MSTLDNIEVSSVESNNSKTNPALIGEYTELIKLDNELNKCPYYLTLITNDNEIDDFKRLYNSISLTEGLPNEAIGKVYDVNSYARLMIKDKSVKLTAAKLENNVFVIAIPVGKNESGDITYHFTEYTISKGDKTNISEKTKGKIKSNQTYEDRFNYFEQIVLDYVKDMRNGLSELNKTSIIPIASKTKTWEEFKNDFIDKYGYEPDEFDFGTWVKYDSYKFDARDLDSQGHIIPLIIEYSNKNMSSLIQNTEEIVEEDTIDYSEPEENIPDDEEDYELGDNKFVNTDINNKYIIEVEEKEEEGKNRFINEYQSKFFKPEEVLDSEDTIPLSFEEKVKEQKSKRRFVHGEPIKKYSLTSNKSFSNINGKKNVVSSIPLSFNLIKKEQKLATNKKVDKVYELSSVQEFGTSELAEKIKLSQSVPFSKGRVVVKM